MTATTSFEAALETLEPYPTFFHVLYDKKN